MGVTKRKTGRLNMSMVGMMLVKKLNGSYQNPQTEPEGCQVKKRLKKRREKGDFPDPAVDHGIPLQDFPRNADSATFRVSP